MGKSVDNLLFGLGRPLPPFDGMAESARKNVAAALSGEQALELLALASVFEERGEALAGRLLGAAIADAWEALDDAQMLKATQACRRILGGTRH
ncbi:hypothetical protein [Chromobacterium sp. IIBBL 290-4]|uniref:hypothetical protein n=1 Tax=Chromobacterium sp. IIBBL 290-4 TaxID=2953890 RepID=UPI0020B6D15F|nr:hypothetical protein [Chromobacterium sp. IIBBL 290-4]UTH72548.1 hypothetical protein NKT35_13405 [Chromobacterium sp. IIBBL 290-4]